MKTRENLLRGVYCVGWMKPRVNRATENFLSPKISSKVIYQSLKMWKTKIVYEEIRNNCDWWYSLCKSSFACFCFCCWICGCHSQHYRETKSAVERDMTLMQAKNLYWIAHAKPDLMTENFMRFLLSERSFDRFRVGNWSLDFFLFR